MGLAACHYEWSYPACRLYKAHQNQKRGGYDVVYPHSRIVLISAYPDHEFHRQGLESGAVAFLDKRNLDLPTLRQVIDDISN